MSQILPSTLPAPDELGYSIDSGKSFIRTQMDSGRARQRRVNTRPIVKLEITWRMDGTQYNTFKAWWESALKEGAESFFMEVWRGSEFRHSEVRFTGPYRAMLGSGASTEWQVEGQLELLDATDFIMSSEKSAVVHSISGRLPYYRKDESVILGDLPANNTVTEVLVIGRGDIGNLTASANITIGYTGDTNAYVNDSSITDVADNTTQTFTPGTGADSTAREVVAKFTFTGTAPASGEYLVIIQYTV